jgi:hypothetical protein
MKRRTLLQLLAAAASTLPVPLRLRAQTAPLGPSDQMRLRAVAEAVLPQEIGGAGHDGAVKAFVAWIQGYRPDADMDHGYGFTRLRRTPPSPAQRYAAQLDALDGAARTRGSSFADLPLDERRHLIEAALVTAKVERLPGRPDGSHVAADLMGFYFNSIEANDLCYRARIARDTCRGLAGSENKPAPLAQGGR